MSNLFSKQGLANSAKIEAPASDVAVKNIDYVHNID